MILSITIPESIWGGPHAVADIRFTRAGCITTLTIPLDLESDVGGTYPVDPVNQLSPVLQLEQLGFSPVEIEAVIDGAIRAHDRASGFRGCRQWLADSAKEVAA